MRQLVPWIMPSRRSSRRNWQSLMLSPAVSRPKEPRTRDTLSTRLAPGESRRRNETALHIPKKLRPAPGVEGPAAYANPGLWAEGGDQGSQNSFKVRPAGRLLGFECPQLVQIFS